MTALFVLRGARAVDPSVGLGAGASAGLPADPRDVVDLVVEDGRITRLGRGAATEDVLRAEGARVVDGAGLWLLPAFVDLHAHLREPGEEYKEDIASGLAAAAAGGFAHVCVMPNTKPVNDRRAICEAIVARAREVGGPSLHPIGAITVGLRGAELAEMADLKEAGAVGVSDDGRCVTNSAVMKRALEYARTFDLAVIQHAEDHALTEGAQMHEGWVATKLGLRGWPREAEDAIVARDVLLAEATGARYHVAHVSTRGAVRILREAKSRGIAVTAEVTPHHLLLTHEAVLGYDTACKVNPPLREEEDVAALREALADGTLDAIATDHAPHSRLEKDCEFASASPGMIGLELVVPVLLDLVRSGALPLPRFVDALTRAPARVAGLRAPRLAVGELAEIAIVDPEAERRIEGLRTKSRNTPFWGKTFRGRVLATFARGAAVFDVLDAHG